jgi:hypothetical protein
MRTYVLISFITLCLGIVLGGVHLMGDHPRQSTHSVGEDSFELILRFAILGWLAFLLWGS